jgi:2-aminobenzoate-CoA ligase
MPRCWRTEIRAAGAPGPAHHPVLQIQCRGRPGRPGRPVRRQVRRVCTPCPTAADDIALMAFTSGTTGKPKAAMHTHRDVLAACECWPRHVLQGHARRHRDGLAAAGLHLRPGRLLMFPMWAGASVYYPDIALHPEAMVRLIGEVGATICYTAPTFYRQMAPFAKAVGIPALRICVSAGEGLPDATRQLWKRGHRHRDARRHRRHRDVPHLHLVRGAEVRRGAIGKVVPGYTAKVVDDEGNEVPRGTVGKLAVIGPTGCKLPGRRAPGQLCEGRLELPRRRLPAGRRRLLLSTRRATDDMIITAGYNVGGPRWKTPCCATRPWPNAA